MIDPYLQQLMMMEREGSCIVPLVKVPINEEHTYLSAMQIVKGLKKGESTFLATIENLGKENGTKDSLPPIIEEVFEENKDVMAEDLLKILSPRHKVDHKIQLEVGAKPPSHESYCMAPPMLEDLRK